MQITGERFVLRSQGSYIDRFTGDVTPTPIDFGTFDEMPPAEDCAAALIQFHALEERNQAVGITLAPPQIVKEQLHTRRFMRLRLSSWHVAETFPLTIEA